MAKTAATAKPRRRGSWLWLQGLVCGAVVTLSTPIALLAGVLLLPTLIVAALDQGEGRPVARAVMLCGLAGSALPMMALWNGGRGMDQSLSLVTDMGVVAVAWAAQGAGWLVAELAPLGVRLMLEAKVAAETLSLRSQRAKLAEDWDALAAPGDGTPN
jgi:hypothetical protein